MTTELDEVYIAYIKSMFTEFDDEIIWSAIFEHGYDEDGEYNSERTINYLLELSGNNVKSDTHGKDKNIEDIDDSPKDEGLLHIITNLPNLFRDNSTHEYTQIQEEDTD